MEQLADIYDFVSPCFPPKYDMFRVIFRKYHEHMAFMLDCVGACAESLANADILKARSPWPLRLLACSPAMTRVPTAWFSDYVHTVCSHASVCGTHKQSMSAADL